MIGECLEKAPLQPAIRGKIADGLDSPVSRARVVLCGSKLGRRLSTLTGREGTFLFSRLPPGVYTLEVNCKNFSKLVQRGISVQDDAITGVDMKMDLQEDSRSLKLRSLRLNYVAGEPGGAAAAHAGLTCGNVEDALAGLRLERTLFHAPDECVPGRKAVVEFGLFQNLKGRLVCRLLERGNGLFLPDQAALWLQAELRAGSGLVATLTPSAVALEGPRYLNWQWEFGPGPAGPVTLRLGLSVRVVINGGECVDRDLLTLEHNLTVHPSPLAAWRWRLLGALKRKRRYRPPPEKE